MSKTIYPQNKEAEEALLGSVLINPDCFKWVNELIYKSHFYIIRNNWIWGIYERLYKGGIPIDILTVSEELAKDNQLQPIGGTEYLLELVNKTPTSLHALGYAKLVFDSEIERRILKSAEKNKAKPWEA